MAMTTAERQARYRARREREEGLVQVQVYAHPEDADHIRRIAREFVEARRHAAIRAATSNQQR